MISLVVLALAVFAFFHFRNRQLVGEFAFNIPGATVFFLDNGSSAGNEKVFTIKGQKTDIQIDFNDIMAYAGHANLSDMKAAAEDWRSTQAKPPISNFLKETWFGPFDSGKVKGYYQLAEVHRTNGSTGEQRNLFFARDGKPYQVSFTFTNSDIKADQDKVNETWETLLDKIGVSPLSLYKEN